MAEMDQGIKRLLQTHPADVLALAVPGAEYLGTLPVDLATEPQLVLDTLLRARYHGVECAVDVEAEARPKPDMARRCFEYGARASIVTGLPVISVVLWLEAGGTPPTSPYELRAGDRLLATWHFIGIEIYKLHADALFATGLPGVLPLVPFTDNGDDLRVIERAAANIKEQAPASDIQELESLLAVFGTRTVGPEAMRALIRRVFMSTEILETSALYREWIAKGKAEGKAEGEAEGSRNAALVVLRSRFGELAPEMTAALESATPEAIDELLAHVALDSLEQIRARLGL